MRSYNITMKGIYLRRQLLAKLEPVPKVRARPRGRAKSLRQLKPELVNLASFRILNQAYTDLPASDPDVK